MELQSTRQSYPSDSDSAVKIGLRSELSSDSQRTTSAPASHTAASTGEAGQSRQCVSADEAQRLYRQFRRATLESTARELQRQVQAQVTTRIPSAGQADAATLTQQSSDRPNRFDVNLGSLPQVEFLGLRFQRMPQRQAIDTLFALTQSDSTYRVYFANAHSIEVSHRNPDLYQALKRSSLLLADGSGVLLGSRLTGRPLVHNLNGTDLIPALCQTATPDCPLSVYFLGAKPGVANQAAANLSRRYPGMRVAGVQDGYFSPDDLPSVLQTIRDAKPDVLLVAMGTPLQEIWIDRHAGQLPGMVCIAVGGLFDFMAGRVRRAPRIIRYLGIEWIWRLVMEPSRLWKRYTLGNLVYLNVLVRSFLKHWLMEWRSRQA